VSQVSIDCWRCVSFIVMFPCFLVKRDIIWCFKCPLLFFGKIKLR
jgi:hypothetical protein